jgi:hypothetical protein
VDYIRLGGLGATDNKLVVVIGSERSASLFSAKLKSVLLRTNGPSFEPFGRMT